VDICVFAFDALCVGGRDLMGLSLRERRAALAAALPGLAPGIVQMAEGIEVTLPLPLQSVTAMQQAAATAVDEAAALGAAGEGGEAAAAAAAAAGAAGSVIEAAAAGSPAEEYVTEFFFAALAAGSEGLMMKLLDGPGGQRCAMHCTPCLHTLCLLSAAISQVAPARRTDKLFLCLVCTL
jgi:hypothetical protein